MQLTTMSGRPLVYWCAYICNDKGDYIIKGSSKDPVSLQHKYKDAILLCVQSLRSEHLQEGKAFLNKFRPLYI